MAFLDGAVMRQPSMLIGAEADSSLGPPEICVLYETLESCFPTISKKVLLPVVGHSAAEEDAGVVNDLSVEFLGLLDGHNDDGRVVEITTSI